MRPQLLCLLAVLSQPSLGADDDALLRARVERRHELVGHLLGWNAVSADLATIARLTPPTVALSRLTFARASARWTLAFSKGTRAEVDAMLAELATTGVCGNPVVTQSAAGLSATCAMASERRTRRLAAASRKYAAPSEKELAVLRDRIVQSRAQLPDELDLEDLKVQLVDSAAKGYAADVTVTVTGPRADGPLDVYGIVMTGTASLPGVWSTVANVAAQRRLVAIDLVDLTAPRVKNGEWVVDFTLHADTYRYRVEEEAQAQSFTVYAIGPKRTAAVDALPPSPFGDDALAVAGSRRALNGTECRTEGKPSPLQGFEPDAVALAYVVESRCAMLVDDQNGCHEVKLNERWGAGKVTAISADAVTVTRLFQAVEGRVLPQRIVLKGPARSKPPAWFCRAK